MDKPREKLNPFEKKQQEEQDYTSGYTAYLDGGPPTVANDSSSWKAGWDAAKAETSQTPRAWQPPL